MNKPQLVNVVDVICRSFRHLNPDLISHGERVAYILMKMLEDTKRYTPQEKHDLFMLGLLHDIGAYRDDEIDSMLNFDTEESMEHSVFGYLLFKTLSPLPQYADVILYHHHCNAQYYPVPIDNYHRGIAKLLYLADCIDIFYLQHPEDDLSAFLEQYSEDTFFPSDISWFWNSERKYHILDNIRTMEYRNEVSDYMLHHSNLTEEQTLKYIDTFIFSIDFRSEYTALHTEYAVQLSKNIAQALQIPAQTCKSIESAALFHNAGKASMHAIISAPKDYADHLKALYSNDMLEVTKEILSDNIDAEIIEIIDESFLLLNCWTKDQPIDRSHSQAAEIVALSYLMSNELSLEMNVSYCHHPRLLALLREKYKICHMDDTILKALEKSFDQIIERTQSSCSSTYDIYHQMMNEYRSLNIILEHYNRKY